MKIKRVTTLLISSALALSLSSGLTMAGPHGSKKNWHKKDYRQEVFYDYGKVTSATPIYQTFEHKVPVRSCDHHRRHSYHGNDNSSATSAILGGIIGAAIGNELGHKKSNKRVGAVAGGLLGASIGSDIERRNRKPAHNNYYCEEEYRVDYEERIVGYNVRYRYRGQIFHTETYQHPGNRIRLRFENGARDLSKF